MYPGFFRFRPAGQALLLCGALLSTGLALAQPVQVSASAGGSTGGPSGAATAAAPVPARPGAEAPEAGAPTDYRIGPNDLLDIEVFGVSELKRQVRVNTTGHVSMPLIGLVPVAGMTAADAEALIALAYADKYLQDPQVSIFVREFTTQRITMDGALVKPGIYPLVGQITLLRALAMAMADCVAAE